MLMYDSSLFLSSLAMQALIFLVGAQLFARDNPYSVLPPRDELRKTLPLLLLFAAASGLKTVRDTSDYAESDYLCMYCTGLKLNVPSQVL